MQNIPDGIFLGKLSYAITLAFSDVCGKLRHQIHIKVPKWKYITSWNLTNFKKGSR